MWNKINTNEDISSLMQLFGHFHDSCIKEIKYTSGAYVDQNLSMNPVNDKRIVDIVFQRQYHNPTTIVIRFIEINMLHLTPCDSNYTCEIHGASFFIKNGNIYWVDCHEIEDEIENYNGTWICSNKVQWRIIDECIGNDIIFYAKYE
jgi:hypothetical protein